MSERIAATIEAHPLVGGFAALISFVLGVISWFVQHADDAAKVFGFFAAIFAMIAGYYTMRIQRRTWHRGARRRFED